MRTLRTFLAAGVLTGLLATSATATPLTLQYDVTVTQRCVNPNGPCSTVTIGGLDLSLTTDDTIVSREVYPTEIRAHFGPTTLAIDTSGIGDFANPFGSGRVLSTRDSFIDNIDTGSFENTTVFLSDLRVEERVAGDTSQQYWIYRTLGLGRDGVPDGRPANLTSADVGILLAQDLLFYHSVRAYICTGSDPCTVDPRSFDSFGVARFRESSAPIPEPGTVVLFGLGLAAIDASRRRRRSGIA